MRGTPSGGVGSIQDQGVNYIQLNIQPAAPLLNAGLRNATLNKDYERSRPLDRAQAPLGRGRPARGEGRWGAAEGRGASRGREPAWGAGARLPRAFPFSQRQTGDSHTVLACITSPQARPQFPSRRPGRLPGLRHASQASPRGAGARGSGRPGPGRGPIPAAPTPGGAVFGRQGRGWARGTSWALGPRFPAFGAEGAGGKGAPEGRPRRDPGRASPGAP